jgi:outer membrane autotransporter protein
MIHGSFDDYQDSAGAVYQDASVRETSGTGSAKLFFSHKLDDAVFRPFAQAGFSKRFDGENTVTVDGAEFSYDDADLTAFGRIGIDIDHGEIQSYFALRGDASNDYRAISGQVGITFKLK